MVDTSFKVVGDSSQPSLDASSTSFLQTLRTFSSELDCMINAKKARQEEYRQLFKPEEGFLSFEPDKKRPGFLAITRCYKETFFHYQGERIQMPLDDDKKYHEMLDYCFENCLIDIGYFADFQKMKIF